MDYLSDCIADFYIKRNIIDPSKKEIYKTGLLLILNDIISFSIIIILSAVLWNIRFAVEFLLTFCLTRIYCGGYHAKKSWICRLTMLVTFFAVISTSYLLNSSDIWVILITVIFSFFMLLPIIPVKHPNKHLSEEQRKNNRIKGIISFILFAIGAILLFFLFKQDGIIIALSLFAVSLLALIGTITNERKWQTWTKNYQTN